MLSLLPVVPSVVYEGLKVAESKPLVKSLLVFPRIDTKNPMIQYPQIAQRLYRVSFDSGVYLS
jgi:hypothetical protein